MLPRELLKDGLYQLAPTFGHVVSKVVPSVKSKTFAANVSTSLNKCKGQSMFSPIQSSSVNVAHINNVCQQWHARLGHPSFHVLQFILNKINIPCSSFDLSLL